MGALTPTPDHLAVTRRSILLSGEYLAAEAEGAERDRLWAKTERLYSGYASYQQRAGDRRIPIVILSPLTS